MTMTRGFLYCAGDSGGGGWVGYMASSSTRTCVIYDSIKPPFPSTSLKQVRIILPFSSSNFCARDIAEELGDPDGPDEEYVGRAFPEEPGGVEYGAYAPFEALLRHDEAA